jgi:hypothetical protein
METVNPKDKVYLEDGPLRGEVRGVGEGAEFGRFEPNGPNGVLYVDSGRTTIITMTIRIFEHQPPREVDPGPLMQEK